MKSKPRKLRTEIRPFVLDVIYKNNDTYLVCRDHNGRVFEILAPGDQHARNWIATNPRAIIGRHVVVTNGKCRGIKP